MIVSLITEKKNIQPSFQQKFHSRTFTSTLQKDVFVKNCEQEFLSLPSEEIIKNIEESLKNIKNKLGTGVEANVWKIKNSSYCVRIPIGVNLDKKDSINKNLTKEDNVNHTVAKFSNGITIMPIIDGVTFSFSKFDNFEIANIVEKMPIKSYLELIEQISYAETQTELIFDSSCKNIIINKDTNKMTAIDFYKKKYRDIYSNKILSRIYLCLTRNTSTSLEQKKICANKIILATLEFIKNQDANIKSLGLSDFVDFLYKQDIIDNFNDVNSIKNILNKLKSLDNNESSEGASTLATL